MYNSVIQMVDLKLEVVYPIEYIAKAIPLSHPAKENILTLSRYLLLNGEYWSHFINNSLFYHPREIACAIFDQAIILRK